MILSPISVCRRGSCGHESWSDPVLPCANQDIAQLCQQERESGNHTSYCLEYLLASTEYDAFVQMMYDFHGIKEFHVDGSEFEGLECLGFGALEGLLEGLYLRQLLTLNPEPKP